MRNIYASLQTTAEQAVSEHELEGKVVVITGGTSGIGLETARVLAGARAEVIIGARNLEEAAKVVRRIETEAGSQAKITLMPLDLSSFRSIHRITREGFEYQLGVNFLGHVELAKGLLEKRMLGQTFASRVVVVTCKLPLQSQGAVSQLQHWQDVNFNSRPYSPSGAFAQSKIALAVWASELSRRMSKTSVGVFIVHPGVALTRIYRWLPVFNMLSLGLFTFAGIFVKSIPQAASTTVYCCAKPHLWDTGHGKFFENCRASRAPAVLFDQTFGAHLWHKTEELLSNVQIDSHEPIDYNVGRAIFMRFWDIFLEPFLQRLGLLRAAEKNL